MQRRVICGFILATNNYDTGKEIDDALRWSLQLPAIGIFWQRSWTVSARVEQLLTGLSFKYAKRRLSVMSSLAEGADRRVAEVALGIGLVVPLPMPRHLYERDFSPPDSLEQFRALCTRASELFELPMARRSTVEQLAEPGPLRNREHAQLAEFGDLGRPFSCLGVDRVGMGRTCEVGLRLHGVLRVSWDCLDIQYIYPPAIAASSKSSFRLMILGGTNASAEKDGPTGKQAGETAAWLCHLPNPCPDLSAAPQKTSTAAQYSSS